MSPNLRLTAIVGMGYQALMPRLRNTACCQETVHTGSSIRALAILDAVESLDLGE